ncbi:MAG TPA: hypothetical protein P5337_11915 [Aestuariivirga sp.]|nr:hypothetical protein [Aestuariivirga sp.]
MRADNLGWQRWSATPVTKTAMSAAEFELNLKQLCCRLPGSGGLLGRTEGVVAVTLCLLQCAAQKETDFTWQ